MKSQDDLLAGGGSADNIALDSEADQVWADLGFKFWWDANQDFIGDALQGGLSMILEQRNALNTSDPLETNAESPDAFVNGLLSGPFTYYDENGYRNWRPATGSPRPDQFDLENNPDEGLMGDYVLRGKGVRVQTDTPTLLIEYTLPTSSGSGWLWDIDEAYQLIGDGYGTPELNGGERWLVEVFTNTDQDGDATNGPDLLTSILSPLGQAVWVPTSDADNPIYQPENYQTGDPFVSNPNDPFYNPYYENSYQPLSSTLPDGSATPDGWLYNPNSLDGLHWEWSFDVGEAIADYVRISYVGNKENLSNVGVAFDRFQAFGQPTETADFLFEQPESNPEVVIGNYVWFDSNRDGIQNDGSPDDPSGGVEGVTVRLYDETGINLLQETTTLFNGSYQFTVEGNTDYQIKFSLPTGEGFSGFTTQDSGTDDSIDSDVDTTGTISLVSVKEVNDFTFDAGLIKYIPDIDIEKATNMEDADTPTGPVLEVGETATFTYVVTNTGEVALENVIVVDDNGTPLDPSDDFKPTLIDNDGSGGTTGDNVLSVGESWTYQYDHVVTEGQYTNIGTVTATPVPTIPGVPSVTDSDPSNHFGQDDNNNGGQGLTIGAWKQFYQNRNKGGKNAEKYKATWVASGYEPSDLYSSALLLDSEDDLLNTLGQSTYDDIAGFDGEAGISLIDALNVKGNANNYENFLRQSTAGFLNAANPDISYEYGVGEVRGFAQDVFAIPATLTASEINALATDLDVANNAGNVNGLW